MGASLSWVAARGKSPALVLRALGMKTTGAREPKLGWSSSADVPYVGVELSDWYVAVANGEDHFASPLVAKALSASCEVVTCLVDSHAMVSEARGWKGGKPVWSVVHDTYRKGRDHLAAKGELPAAWDAIRRGATQRPRDEPPAPSGLPVDRIFEIPILLAEAVTGFRHDGPSADREMDVLAKRP